MCMEVKISVNYKNESRVSSPYGEINKRTN